MDINETDPNNAVASRHNNDWRAWLPTRGNVLFVLVVAGAMLLYVRTAGAIPGSAPLAASTSVIPYQGRLADSSGNALNGSYAMTFGLYSVPSGGSALWTENWSGGNSVTVASGLFNVLLGSLTTIPQTIITNNTSLWLGITVGGDSEMIPRIQLGSAPYARQAEGASADSITTSALADGAVTSRKLNASEAYSHISTQEITTSTTPISLATADVVTITLEATEWVDITYGATASTSSNSYPAFIGLNIDAGSLISQSVIETWSSPPVTIAGVYRTQLPAGAHTIRMLYATELGGTAVYWNRKILAFVISQ